MSAVIARDRLGGVRRWHPPAVDGLAPEQPLPPQDRQPAPPTHPPTRQLEASQRPEPDVADGGPPPEPAPRPPTVEEIEAIRRDAYEQGLAQGRRDGLARGQAEVAARAERLAELLAALEAPLAELDAEVEEQLLALVVSVARQLVRRELKTSPGEVVAVVREALGLLPASRRGIRLFLHPEDAELVREALSLSEDGPQVGIVEDSALTRGGCKVLTEDSVIDASVEHRLNHVISHLLGGERADDRTPEAGP